MVSNPQKPDDTFFEVFPALTDYGFLSQIFFDCFLHPPKEISLFPLETLLRPL